MLTTFRTQDKSLPSSLALLHCLYCERLLFLHQTFPWVSAQPMSLSPVTFLSPHLLVFFSHLSVSLFLSRPLSPSPSLSFSFCLGRHPEQIVALRISLKGCWWSTLPILSKCALVHLSVHCLEMDYWSWRSKGKEKRGGGAGGRLHIWLLDEGES